VEWADQYAQPGTVERAETDRGLGLVSFYSGRSKQGVDHVGKALELARRLNDPETFWQVAGSWLFLATAPQHEEEALRLAEELAAQPRPGVSVPRLGLILSFIGSTFLAWGQRGRAEEVWRELDELAALGRRLLALKQSAPHRYGKVLIALDSAYSGKQGLDFTLGFAPDAKFSCYLDYQLIMSMADPALDPVVGAMTPDVLMSEENAKVVDLGIKDIVNTYYT